MVTDDEMAAVEAAATPLPWEQRSDGWTIRGPSGTKVATTWQSGDTIEREVANQEFIAFAREWVPDALKRLRDNASIVFALQTETLLQSERLEELHRRVQLHEGLQARGKTLEHEVENLRKAVRGAEAGKRNAERDYEVIRVRFLNAESQRIETTDRIAELEEENRVLRSLKSVEPVVA